MPVSPLSPLRNNRSKHMLLRPYEYDSIVQNPISEADFKWILHRNCEGTEQLHEMNHLRKGRIIYGC